RLVASEHRVNFKKEVFKSGIPGLDDLLVGGLHRGTSSMFMGPPGTGKSTLALKYAYEAAERGEQGAIFIFDETTGTLLDRGAALRMDVSRHVESGKLTVEEIDPAEISPGELMWRVCSAVEERNARIVVIDSVNWYLNAM